MSDWGMYDLDDIVWDEFGECGDHIVPLPSGHQSSRSVGQVECQKKPRREVEGPFERKTDIKECSAENVILGKVETATTSTQEQEKAPMLDKNSWCQIHDNGDTECINTDSALTPNNTKLSDNCFKTGYVDSVENEFCTDADNNLCQLQLPDISTTDNELNLFRNQEEDEECNDLLDYGWPDIGNFEDVDQMFRSCDSTFGQSDGNADEPSWFSPPLNAKDTNENGYKSEIKAKHENAICNMDGESIFIGEYKEHVCSTLNCWASDVDDPSKMGIPSYSDWLYGDGRNKEESGSWEQVNTSNCGAEIKSSPLPQIISGSSMTGHHAADMVNKQSQLPNNRILSKSKRKDRCFGYLNGTLPEEKMEKVHHRRMQAHTINRFNDSKFNVTFSDNAQDLKQRNHNQDEFASESEAEGTDIDLDSSTIQEGSCMSSVLSNGVSAEAISFCQLQDVMEQLDLRTKLCIRDSLYRLARSAEQRHNHCSTNSNSSNSMCKSGGPSADESNKFRSVEFMDVETNTNPIDRSMVHLLFYRVPNTSPGSANDAISHESRALINASVVNQPAMPDQINGGRDARC